MKEFNFTKGITHAGSFHGDEVMATAIMLQINPSFRWERVFNVSENVSKDTIVYDIGHGEYDHHQKGGNGCRDDGTMYSSAGLIWRDFGHMLVSCDDVVAMVDKALIESIDSIDNGQLSKREEEFSVPSFSSIISGFNPTWDSSALADEAFKNAVSFATSVLLNTIANAESKYRAKSIVDDAIEEMDTESGIIVLDRYVPWQDYVLNNPKGDSALYVVFPNNRGDWAVQAIPTEPGSFENRKPLPVEWRGLRDEELREITGLPTATFVHNAGFIGSCKEKNDTMKMAKMAVDW